jgi:hypothetical protein
MKHFIMKFNFLPYKHHFFRNCCAYEGKIYANTGKKFLLFSYIWMSNYKSLLSEEHFKQHGYTHSGSIKEK